MKTVIHYKDSYLPLTETWVYGQIENLEKYQPIVYALYSENLDIYPVERIRSLKLKKKRNMFVGARALFDKVLNKMFGFYPSFLFYIPKDRPSLVHAHFGPSGFNFLKIKNIYKIPMITTFYGYDLGLLPSQFPEWKTRYKKLFKEGEVFLVEGEHMKKCLADLGCPESKIIVQHLGVSVDDIRFAERKFEKNKEVKILTAAGFREKKGIPYAVEAFGQVRQRCPDLNLTLTIIGDSDGSREGELEKKKIFGTAKKCNVERYVVMKGYQPHNEVLREMLNSHIFIHPSVRSSSGDTEGGAPVCIIEALASGMPVISTTHCDIPEVVMDGKSGYLAPERDAAALAEKLEFLIKNPHVWAKMGYAGRKRIEENYDVKKQVRKLEEIYDEAVKRKNGRR